MAIWSGSKKGTGFIVLNVLRVMNIIGLLAVAVASWVMLVKTFIVSKFFFFDAVSHIITSVIALFLIVSELPIFKSYFSRNWPLLSLQSGLVTLGFAMMICGFSILGNLNKQATSQESLGLALWRIVIAAGIVVTVLGAFNIVASYLFRDNKLNVTARQVRSHGATAPQKAFTLSSSGSTRSKTMQHTPSVSTNRGSVRFMPGRVSPIIVPHLQRSSTTPPTYQASTRGTPNVSTRSISNPIVIDEEQMRKMTKGTVPIERPDSAYHPSHYPGGYSNVV